VKYAQQLAKRVGEELQLPVYLYEAAQPVKQRSNLSHIRAVSTKPFAKKILATRMETGLWPGYI